MSENLRHRTGAFSIDQVVDEVEQAMHIYTLLDAPFPPVAKCGSVADLPKRKTCSICADAARDDPCDGCYAELHRIWTGGVDCVICLDGRFKSLCGACGRSTGNGDKIES